MLRLLSYNHLFTYVVLFLITVAVRLPSFHPAFYEQDEAFYLVCAQKIVDGGVQYVDTWDNKPPVLVWFYTLFVWIFGSGAIIAIRVFTCIYLYIAALLLNQFVIDNKLLEKFSLLPGFLFVFLCSVPWYAQELNGELLINLPVMVALMLILNLAERSPQNNKSLFGAGILLGLCFMIKYQAVFLMFGLIGGYLTVQTPRLSELFSLAAGFILALFVLIGIVFLTGAFDAFWDIGVIYNIDYVFLGRNPGEIVSPWANLGQYLQLWGPFVLIGLIGVVHFRLSYFTNSIRLRKVEAVLLYWFGAAVITVLIGGGRLYLHYFYLMVPPLAVYAAKFFELRMNPWLRQAVLGFAMFVPMYTFGVFLASAFPGTFSFIDPYLTHGGWIDSFRHRLNDPHPLEKYIDKSKVENGILLMEYEPEVYARLGLPCATKYTNFSMAYFKLEAFRDRTGQSLVSHTESLAETFRAFRDAMPEYILDPLNIFPILKDKIPILFASYRPRLVTDKHRSYYLYFR